MQIYTIYDKKSQSYSDTIFTAVNDAVATRILSMSIARDEMLFKHAHDFDLYHIGNLDQQNGHLSDPENPKFIINLTAIKNDLLKEEENNE